MSDIVHLIALPKDAKPSFGVAFFVESNNGQINAFSHIKTQQNRGFQKIIT